MRVEPSAAGVPAESGPAALVAGVEQAAEVFVGVAGLGSEDGVGFVDQQGGRIGRVLADGPVDRRGRGVGGQDRLVAQGFDEVEQAGLAASFLRGLDDQPGRGVPGRNGVGGGDPQHDRGRGVVVGQDDVGADRGFDLVQQLGAVDQLDDDGRRRGWSCDAPVGGPVRGSAMPRVRPEVMVASASAAVKAPARDVVGAGGSRRWSRTVCSSTRPPATSWPRATAAENRVWFRVPGGAVRTRAVSPASAAAA